MYRVLDTPEEPQKRIRLPRVYLFKWYEITMHTIISLTYFWLTSFLIWRLKGKVPKAWYEFGKQWESKTRNPLLRMPEGQPAQTKAVSLR